MPIICQNLSVSFGDKQVIKNFTHRFRSPGITAIMGASGVGKTTLFRLILGLETPQEGKVTGLDGKKVSVVFQEDRLFPQLNVLQNVLVSESDAHPIGEEQARRILHRLGLAGEENAPVGTLSGGMRRRVALARALCYDGDYFLLDEPLKGLDAQTRADVIDVLRPLAANKTVLFITHDRAEVELLADSCITLQEGGTFTVQELNK